MNPIELPSVLANETIALWRECGLTRPWNDPHADLKRFLDGSSSTVLAVVEDGVLAGTAIVGHDGHRGWVYFLTVRPDRRGTGMGRSLMESSERWLLQRGVPKIQLMVRTIATEVVAF